MIGGREKAEDETFVHLHVQRLDVSSDDGCNVGGRKLGVDVERGLLNDGDGRIGRENGYLIERQGQSFCREEGEV